MTNQIRPVDINSFDACRETEFNCQNIVRTEVNNMTKQMTKKTTNNQSQLKFFGMMISVPIILMGNINPVLSIGLSQQREIANSQFGLDNSLVSKSITDQQNNYLNINRTSIATQLTSGKSVLVESANFSENTKASNLEVFLSSGYYSKDCRRRKVCDD